MQERFKPRLDGDFSLHYEDLDFDGDLCLLVDIQKLPEKGTLRVVRPEGVSDICPQPLVTQRPDSGPAPLPLSDVVEVEVEVESENGPDLTDSGGSPDRRGDDTTDADSFLLLFGNVYALDLQYPKNLELTFIQVVMCLEDNKPLKGRLLTSHRL
ncbi:hypothetical protein D5F01_LYC25368 [Larimichthys crocea]|uniref:Uncharacterized protein n=1 Tax=Larimichthys crocea TaxID=215358 RepID=A0A6G0HD73_LARCR|nr:hypothetical protein D5F01_LYC25368 [Larimichthys crocea]